MKFNYGKEGLDITLDSEWNITIFKPSEQKPIENPIEKIKESIKNPERLVEFNSPPCLIFQGTHDILNYFSISQNIRNTYYAKGNEKCIILWMPLGGHASDFYFTGYYNQIFLYYMERFLYPYH